jgi:phosphate starvation-inducible protein PhoH and related proteins
MTVTKLEVRFTHFQEVQKVFGDLDRFLSMIEQRFHVQINSTGDDIMVASEDIVIIDKLNAIFALLQQLVAKNQPISERDVQTILNMADAGTLDQAEQLFFSREPIIRTLRGKMLYPKTLQQQQYLKAMQQKAMVFAIGPAGTGKTYLAVLYALKLLKENTINRIILTRPAVEAGENLGFLPGDLREKLAPYLQPLYDALYEIVGKEQVEEWIDRKVVEIAPLAYMRGRTLSDAFVILDEAQNTTEKQMKMFLTRLGYDAKMVITGDLSQVDLPGHARSGLLSATKMVDGIPGIEIIRFEKTDSIRHPLVQAILARYEQDEQ